jgi:hypothetical protein
MDVRLDRFIALTPLSSAIWSGLVDGSHPHELIDRIMRVRTLSPEAAASVLRQQVRLWQQADLVGGSTTDETLPVPKPSAPPVRGEITRSLLEGEPISPLLVAALFLAERRYRRAIAEDGLASALKTLQGEASPHELRATPPTLFRVLRAYHLLRRAFRQGHGSQDCLFRSLALAAVLRRAGLDADLCIGIIDLPFSSHAWVECDGVVANETLSIRNAYCVIGRF